MDHSLSARSVSALATIGLLASAASALAQEKITHYDDVPAGAWYEQSASALIEIGALDQSEDRLRPHDPAKRAEMIKLLVNVQNVPLQNPSINSFDDVRSSAWYYMYVETAAEQGWVHGDDDCYRHSKPCTARPNDTVNRAEAAALLVRAFELEYKGAAPVFADNFARDWYYRVIQTAADHCILQGDDVTGRVRPGFLMNRAEMVVMFDRASRNLEYGQDCGPAGDRPDISEAEALSAGTIRLRFSTPLNVARAEAAARYSIARIDTGETVRVGDVDMVNSNTAELGLLDQLQANVMYRVSVSNLRTAAGVDFDDTATVRWEVAEQPGILRILPQSASRVQAVFATDLDADSAEEKSRYRVVAAQGEIDVISAIQVDSKTVELRLRDNLQAQGSYRLHATGLRTSLGTIFSDSAEFVFAPSNVLFRATLLGVSEVPPVVTTASGTGSMTLTPDGLLYDITLRSLSGSSITGAHFHQAIVGVNGPVVEPITFTGNRATGTWKDLTAAERDALLRGEIYVNVHTAANPNGEIRGQLIAQ